MQIFTGIDTFYSVNDTAAAIGKFDGVHLGHRLILEDLLRQKEDGLRTCVFTFDPSPEVFFGLGDGKELMTREEKRRIFREAGIDLLVEYPFTAETAAMPAEDFVRDVLIGELNVRYMAAGPDLSFGKGGAGNFTLLAAMSRHYDFEARMIHKKTWQGKIISSTLIRRLVTKGRMEDAAACLGRPYSIQGYVVHGTHLGTTIGIPTLNQIPPHEKILPPYGVYFSEVRAGGKTYKGMTNIGVKPTVSSKGLPNAETYLFDFSGDLYGQNAEVRLLTFRRPERKMSGIEELRATIREDLEEGRRFHGLTGGT